MRIRLRPKPVDRFRSRLRLTTVLAFILLVTASAAPTPAQQTQDAEHFVPADQLDAVFDETTGVLLPRAEYRELVEKAEAARLSRAGQPAALLIRSASYRVQPADSQALVRLSLDVEQFEDGWQTIRIPSANLHLEQAMIGDTPATIGRVSGSELQLFHETPGRFTVELSFSTPVGRVGSDHAVAFGLIPEVPVHLEADCPAGRHLLLFGRRLQRPQPVDQATTYQIPIGRQGSLKLRWTSRREDAAADTLVFARSDAQIQLSVDTLRWQTVSRLSVFGGQISQLTATVPATLEITAVESTGLESWELSDDPDRSGHTRMTLTWRQPFDADRLITIRAVAPVTSGEPARIPPLVYNEVTAHTGRLIITQEDQLRLTATSGDGIRQLVPKDSGQSDGASPTFDFWLQDYELSVAVRPRDRELFSQLTSSLGISDSQALLTTSIVVETLNAPLFETELNLPEGWQLLTVTNAAGQPLTWRGQDGSSMIKVESASPVPPGGLFQMNLRLTRPVQDPAEPQQMTLPVVGTPKASMVAGRYTISSTPDLQIAPAEIRGLVPTGEDSGNIVFEAQGTVISGTLNIARRPARLSSRSEIRCWRDARQTTTTATITVDVINGTTRELQIRLPEETGEDLRFIVKGIRPVPGYEATEMQRLVPSVIRLAEARADAPSDGSRLWHLTFDRRFAGSVTLTTRIQQPLEEGTAFSAPAIDVIGAIHQEGLIAFEASPDQQFDEADDQAIEGLRPADPSLVTAPAALTGRRIARVYQFVQPDWTVSLQETRYDTQPVPTAVCRSVANVSVLGETGSIQRSCRVQLQCVGVQTLRFTLPDADNAFLWSTVLNDEAVEVRRDGADYLVAVPTGDRRTNHVLELLFESKGTSGAGFTATRHQPVQFAIDVDSSQSAPIDVLEQTWQVQYPSDTMLLDYAGSFHPPGALTKPGWLQSLSDRLSWPGLRKLTGRLLIIVLILGAILLTTVLLVRRHRRVLELLVVAAIIGGLLLLLLPSVHNARESASRERVRLHGLSDAPFEESVVSPRAAGAAVDVLAGETATDEFNGQPQERVGGRININGRDRYNIKDFADSSSPEVDSRTEAELLFDGQLDRLVEPGPDSESGGGEAGGSYGNGAMLGSEVLALEADSDGDGLDAAESAASGPERGTRLRGSARLSVRVNLERPADYQTTTFRSVGSESGQLRLVMQTARQVGTLRLLAAALALIACWMLRGRSLSVRLAAVASATLLALALVPLAPNQWQAAMDGIVFGSLAAAVLWPAAGVINWIQQGRCCRRAATAAVVLMALSVPSVVAEDQTNEAPGNGSPAASPLIEQPRTGVVLPYSPGDPPLTADQVFIPRDQFLKLYEQAYPGDLTPDAGPAEALVTGAFFTGGERQQVEGKHWTQRFKGRFVIRSFHDRPVLVTLPLRRVALQNAQLNEQPAVITRESDGYQVRIAEAGLHLLDVEFDVAATIDASGGRMTVRLKDVPSGLLTLELPDDDLTVQINNNSSGRFRRDGRTVTVPLALNDELSIQWLPATTRGSSDTIVHANLSSTLEINDEGLTLITAGTLNCRQGAISEAELMLPAGYSVRTVEGRDVAGWSVAGSDDAPTLKVVFRTEVSQQTTLRLTLFSRRVMTAERQSFAVPVPEPLGVSRSTGTVCVLAGPELEVQTQSLSGVSQINPGDAQLNGHDSQETQPVLAWRFNRHPADIVIRAFRVTDRMTATVLSAVQLEAERQRWTHSVTVNIQGAPRRRLDLRIPSTWLAFEVDSADLADWYITEASSDQQPFRTLSVQLQSARTGRVQVVFQGQDQRSTDRQNERLSTPSLIDVDEQTTQLSIWQGVATDISGFDGNSWSRMNFAQTAKPLQSLRPDAPGISLTSQDLRPATLTLRLRRATASAMCESVTVTNVTRTSIERTLALSWRIARSAADTFSVELPAAAADTLDFQVAGLRQQERTPLDDGRVRITFHLQYPVSDRFFAAGTGAVPLPATGQFRSIPVAFSASDSERSPLNVASQAHYWVIVNQSDGLLEPVQPDSDTDDIAADQLDTSIPEGFLKQSVAIRRITDQQPGSDWRIRFPQTERTAPAVIALAQHETVLADDGTWRSKHTLQVRNESRQFLPVQLPEGSRPLYCLVRNQPTRMVTRSTDDGILHLIPVPQSGIVNAPFQVEFGIEGSLPNVGSMEKMWQSESVVIPVPRFPEYREDSATGVTVARNTWSVYVPDSWSSVMDDDPRRSNVVTADADMMEDTVVLSSVEIGRELLQQAQQAKDKFTKDHLVRELSTQLKGLKSQRSGSAPTEEDRLRTLQSIEHYVRDNTISSNEQQSTSQDAGGNMVLDSRAEDRNSFNYSNNNDLILSNSASGIRVGQGSWQDGESTDRGQDFGFRVEVSEPQDLQLNLMQQELSVEELTGGRKKSEPQSRGRQRSQLIWNRQSGSAPPQIQQRNSNGEHRSIRSLQRQPADAGDDASTRDDETNLNYFFGAPESGIQNGIQAPQPASQPATADSPEESSAERDEAEFGIADANARPAVSTGLLSLRIAIPTDGRKLDFVRGSGNAALTLDIRPSQSRDWIQGIAWAVFCLVIWQLTLRTLRTGHVDRMLAGCGIGMCAIGTVGWLLLPDGPGLLALLLGLAGALILSIRELRRRPTTADTADA